MTDQVSEQIKKHAEEGKGAVLVCITMSSGSTPRAEGACMLVDESGRVAGTVGGGVLEHECEILAREALAAGKDTTRQFRLDENAQGGLGMVCGGNVDVDFIVMPPGDQAAAERAQKRAQGPARQQVYIFGGGHVAQAVVPALAAVDFACTVLEDRPEFCDISLFPGACDTRLIDNERVLEEVDIGPEDRVIIMTRGHQNDLLIQSQVMRSPARYIGVIGSERKTAALTKRLREMGFTDSDFERVYAPIGLPIRSETPAEIAVSIAAQLILDRAGGLTKDKKDL